MYTYEDFLNIIKVLRSEEGCPWDRQQTHGSLKPCMMEEACEVVASIRIFEQTGNCENLVEELGDVLLQVVMHARIGQEEGLFGMEDVVENVASKMVRRHPHVFGNVEVDSTGQVLDNWEAIKQTEKAGMTYVESPLREIPPELPALTRAPKVLKKADKLYEKQPGFQEAVTMLEDAVARLKQMADGHMEDVDAPVGDILMGVSQISRVCRLSQEQILSDRVEDMIDRMEPRV